MSIAMVAFVVVVAMCLVTLFLYQSIPAVEGAASAPKSSDSRYFNRLRLIALGVGISTLYMSISILALYNYATDSRSFSLIVRAKSLVNSDWTPIVLPRQGSYVHSGEGYSMRLEFADDPMSILVKARWTNDFGWPKEYVYTVKRVIGEPPYFETRYIDGHSTVVNGARFPPAQLCFAPQQQSKWQQLRHILTLEYDIGVMRSNVAGFALNDCDQPNEFAPVMWLKRSA